MKSATPPSRSFLLLTLAVTWIVWGSTFLVIHLATATIPPFLLMGTRFVAAGSIALAIALARTPRADWPTRPQWTDASIVGAGLITVSMGATGWAATRLDTGISALLTASGPLFIAIVAMFGGMRPTRAAAVGLAVGLAGVALLVMPSGGSGATAVDPLGALLLVASNVGWALASVFASRRPSPGVLVGTGMQMLVGGVLLVAVSAAAGELQRVDAAMFTPTAIGSWCFLVALGSLGGFLAYAWLLEHVSTSVASTHAFVNPLVAVALGTLLLGEPFAARTAIAGAAVVVAVVLLMLGARRAVDVPATVSEPGTLPAPARTPVVRTRPRPMFGASGSAPSRARARSGAWSPAPTPQFAAARRAQRPWQATDGMDALEIDDALDAQF